MERIPSIIHKMQERYSEGASASELLFLLEDMRRELTRAIVPIDHTKAPVSVWLPQGYVGPQSDAVKQHVSNETDEKSVKIISEDLEMESESFSTDINVPSIRPEMVTQEDIAEPRVVDEKVVMEAISRPFMSVPRPPLVRVIEPEGDEELPEVKEELLVVNEELPEIEAILVPIAEPILAKKEEVVHRESENVVQVSHPIIQEIIPLTTEPQSFNMDQPEIIPELPEISASGNVEAYELPEILSIADIEKEKEQEKPVVFELDLPQWETEPVHQKWEPLKIPEGFLVGSGFKEALVADKPRELHEILASRVLAKPQGSIQADKSVGVMEKISGGKITDLKKGFTINDRFRFISSLFRGDETMFDRAIKTINNFDILPEAQYWMQRELVIKLGWNDEDELVQHFHQLVMRRFL